MKSSRSLYSKFLLGTIATLPFVVYATDAQAQGFPSTDTPPVRDVVDDYGVDLSDGSLRVSAPVVSIGGQEGLTFDAGDIANGSWRHNYTVSMVTGLINGQQVVRVQIGESRRDFKLISGVYEPLDGLPGTLNSGATVYTDGNGVKFYFTNAAGLYWLGEYLHRLGTKIVFPNGREEVLHYIAKNYTYSSTYGGAFFYVPQLRSVTSNNSYQLKLEYNQANPGIGASLAPTKVTALNNSVEYCDPVAETCNLNGDWPSLDFSGPTGIVDNLGRSTNINNTTNSISVKRPGETQPGLVAQLDSNRRVSSLTVENNYTRTYSWSNNGGNLTSIANDSLGRKQTTTVGTSENVVKSHADAFGNVTSYDYDNKGRLTQITAPEGQKVQYAYDARGNVKTTTRVAEPNSGQSNVTTSASYPTSCTNLVNCNKPTSTTDANGNTTNYIYDANHGGMTRIQTPADSTGKRPTANITYVSVKAKTKNASGSLVDQSTSITKRNTVTQCATAVTCSGSANERVVDLDYNISQAPNGQATKITTRAGNNSVSTSATYTYTDLGLVEAVDGPLAGTADTTTLRYDDAGRTIGVVGPDPDGGGGLPRLAERKTYDDFNNVIISETGTVTGTSQSAWNSFSPTAKVTSDFDSFGRLKSTVQVATSGSTQYSLTEYGYDSALRPNCVAQRLNAPSTGTSTPSSACTPMTAGTYGADRISQRYYDKADRITKVRSGVGSPLAQQTVEMGYNPNGTVAWVEDANDNRTSYTYDGHDRKIKINFPNSGVTGSSSSTDYQQASYDAAGNVLTRRTRRGETISYIYDKLGRITRKTVPNRSGLSTSHTRNVYFGYNLLNEPTYARFGSASGAGITLSYDDIGRPISERQNTDGTVRTVSSQYDVAGRRTRITHPDGKYFTYNYDVLNRMKGLRENNTTLGTMSYNNRGLPTSLNWTYQTASTNRRTYGFDSANRLSSLALDLHGAASDVTWSFGYNPASQVTRETQSNDSYSWNGHVNLTRNYSANGLNQYTSSGSANLSYDANGNLSTDGTNSYQYDVENRLVRVSGGGYTTHLYYDPLGRLYQTSSNKPGHGTLRYLYDGNALIGEYLSNGAMAQRYVHGSDPGHDDPLLWYQGSAVGNASRRYLHADRLGSIVAVTDASGNVIGKNSYDESGIPGIGNIGRFQYTGQVWLGEIGMSYYKARMYSPTLNRFLQTDPIGYDDDMNMYAYVGNDPINKIDPTGLCTLYRHYRVPVRGGVMKFSEAKLAGIYAYRCGSENDGFTYGGTSSSAGIIDSAAVALARGPKKLESGRLSCSLQPIDYTPHGETYGQNARLGGSRYNSDLPGTAGSFKEAYAYYWAINLKAGSVFGHIPGPTGSPIVFRSTTGIQLRRSTTPGDSRYRIDIPAGVLDLSRHETIKIGTLELPRCPLPTS